MMSKQIYIKNMVCDRCILAVRQLATEVGMYIQSVELGVLSLSEIPSENQCTELAQKLEAIGFAVLENVEKRMVESIKRWVLHLVNHPDSPEARWTTSALLVDKIGRDYKFLRRIFKQQTGQTIEQYLIKLRIERSKELMEDPSLTFTQISDLLGYSSVAHFSAQFKKQSGSSPSTYRSMLPPRQVLDHL